MTPRTKLATRAFSLVEMLAAMATFTLVMGLCVALLEMILKLDSTGRQHAENEAAIARVARVFREDVRAATGLSRCEMGADSTALDLALRGDRRSIEYQIIKDTLVRMEWGAGEILEQERFRLPANSLGHFERRMVDGRAAVSLAFERRAKKGKGESSSHQFRITATPGTAHRFSAEGGDDR